MTDEQKQRVAAKMMDRAEQYAADPSKGRADGYAPIYGSPLVSREIGMPRQTARSRNVYCAWLYGIATRDLPAGSWRIDEAMGAGRMSADLVIF